MHNYVDARCTHCSSVSVCLNQLFGCSRPDSECSQNLMGNEASNVEDFPQIFIASYSLCTVIICSY